MVLRLLFLLLIALNVGVAAWLVFGQQPAAPVPATDPGVPELTLLSEPAPAASAARAAPGAHCLALGPFESRDDASQLLARVRAQVQRARLHEQSGESSDWWVYLPAFPTRKSALAMAKTLSAKGVRDYYVVTDGDAANAISLGLFHGVDNARQRRDRIAALGFAPHLSRRTQTVPQYWVQLALARGSAFDWRANMDDPQVHARRIRCF